MKTSVKDDVKRLRRMANILIPYTYPRCSFEEEQEILCLKQTTVEVDGYTILVTFSIAEYKEHRLETLQVQSTTCPFLPFSVVCKVGQLFLGQKNLSYVEFFRLNKKIYCWTLKRKNGDIMPPSDQSTPGSYEGFEYSILNPTTVDLY